MESDPQDADAYRLAGDFLTAAFFLLDLPSFKFFAVCKASSKHGEKPQSRGAPFLRR